LTIKNLVSSSKLTTQLKLISIQIFQIDHNINNFTISNTS